MKKTYEKPVAEKLVFDYKDIITAQSGRTPTKHEINVCETYNDHHNFHPDQCKKIHGYDF